MLSAEDFAAVKIAVEVCCCLSLKKQIFIKIGKKENNRGFWSRDFPKKMWDDNIEKSSVLILKKLGLKGSLQEKIIGCILLIGIKMLIWAKYHERFLGISRDFSVGFLKSYLFTSMGIIDNKKAAEELMKCGELDVKQKYKLACLYCFADEIPVLFKQMSNEEQKEFYIAQRPDLILEPKIVLFWSYDINGEFETLTEEKVLEFLLESAVKSGSKSAVEYFIEKAELTKNKDYIVVAAKKTLYRMVCECYNCSRTDLGRVNDMLDYSKFYVDNLFFLCHKMSVDQKVTLLSNDSKFKFSRFLAFFLNWPYQNYFMPMTHLMWDFLSESSCADLLQLICSKIEAEKGKFFYGEGKTYNYRKLLMEFWRKSSQNKKKYTFNHNDTSSYLHEGIKVQGYTRLLGTLLLLKNFTYEDRRNIEQFSEYATAEEKRDAILSNDGESLCIELIKDERWGRLDLFMSLCLSSEEQIEKFKKAISVSEKAMEMCSELARKQKWNVAESFLKWSTLSMKEINRMKEQTFFSYDCQRQLRGLILESNNMEAADKFCEWFSSSRNQFIQFKRDFSQSVRGYDTCCALVFMRKLELADEFIHWSLSSREIIRYKNLIPSLGESPNYIVALSDPETIDLGYEPELANLGTLFAAQFKGRSWEQVDTALNWCFSSVEKITTFKKALLATSGILILKSFIVNCKWDEAESFLSWIDVSSDEIRNLKTEAMSSMIISEIHVAIAYNYNPKGKWVTIKAYMRWCLADEDSVLDFKKIFNKEYAGKILAIAAGVGTFWENRRRNLNKLYSCIEELQRELATAKTPSLSL